jgi:Tol biopolymer transport system component
VQVTTATTGNDIDADGYTFSIDGGADRAIGADESVTVSSIDPGSHTVQLQGLAANCAVSGQNPVTVSVTAGATGQASFSVTCTALTGDLEVTTATTGADLDDQYSVTIDDGSGQSSQSIGVNDVFTFADLAPGDYSVELTDVATNCSVSGNNPRTVTVSESSTAQTTFNVSCTALTGNLDVITSTTGVELDADGYAFTVDGGAPQAIGLNETVPVASLPVGDHDVELTGVAMNCSVSGSNPVTVGVPSEGTGTATFNVSCSAPANQLVFVTERGGNREIYIMNGDGSGPVNLSNNLAEDNFPDVSPDGTQIVFMTDRDGNNEIYVMGIDGSSPVRLTNSAGSEIMPTWSPDGSKIAFTRVHSASDRDVWVMNADGTGAVNLSNDAVDSEQPTWAPDGSQIAFRTNRDGNNEIYVMNADGSNQTNISNHPDWDGGPSWSPDGALIAFDTNRDGNFEVYVMAAADGSNQVNLTNNPALDGGSANRWTPDSRLITFRSERDGNEEIYTMNADGTNQQNRSGDPAQDRAATWVP